MANQAERTTITTTTTTRTTEGADAIKRNLSSIASEIEKVREKAREEVNSLERIKGMLDVGYLNDLIRSIEQLEVRLQTLESEAVGAATEVDGLRTELRREQERLAKLWEAYKSQEDELANLRREWPILQERLNERERALESLRREVARLEPLSRYKQEYDAAVRENQTLRVEVESLNRELRRTADQLRDLEAETVRLREDAGSKARLAEMQGHLDAERERLAKLYKVYEEQAAELARSTSRLDKWEAWFQKVEPALTAICRAAADAPRA
jgi:chromosome segregation ATPase